MRDNHARYRTLRQDVEHCLSIAQAHQINILVLNQIRQDIQLPVVKVFAPGLRHFWGRFAPGRLYDVPVHLGYAPRPESALNPRPMLL